MRATNARALFSTSVLIAAAFAHASILRAQSGSGSPPPRATVTAPAQLAPLVVTATRTPQPLEHIPFSATSLDRETLRAAPAATVDGVLRAIPGFSLFRRSDSLTANPTAQGVSLRGLGPSGASRSLIVLDGAPLNDPFGGWVAWTLVPRDTLSHLELVRGGGATAWGNAALGGVIQLFTAEPATDRPHLRLTATGGDFATRSGELDLTTPVAGGGSMQLLGRAFATDGFVLVAPEDRGPVDVPAASRHSWLSGRWQQPLNEDLTATLTARTFSEKRNNGTLLQRNATRADFASLALAGRPAAHFAWDALVYVQDQTFSASFSAVNATRTDETPASDQFAVPSDALGAAWTGAWTHADDARTTAGFDARRVRGETRERFLFSNGAFTRQREAGGEQQIGGLFALHERPLGPGLHALVGARLDRWRELEGHRREFDRASGIASRDERYADRAGTEFSPSAGLVWTPDPAWRVRLAAQHAFRRPTLNELYRPFRVGPNVTEANAALRTERVTSGELAIEWHSAGSLPAAARPRVTLGAAVFWNDLRDAVGNVTVAHGPGTFPIVGFISAGGVGRQRLNLDRTRVRGLELSAAFRPSPALTLTADYLYNDATVRRASVAPDLVGKRLAQVPRHSATLAASWRAPAGFRLTPRLRWLGRQFEDDENTLVLGEAVVVDLQLAKQLNDHAELFLTVENLTDARIETGRTATLVNTGTPRFAFGGIRMNW